MTPHYDFNTLYKLCSDACEANGLHMMDLGGNGPEPKPPFVAFDVISPFLRSGYLEDSQSGEFETVLSLTVYDLDRLNALQCADALRQYIGSRAMADQLYKAHAILVERMETQIRNIQNINTEAAMVGFDFRLRLKEPVADPDMITNIKFEEESHG